MIYFSQTSDNAFISWFTASVNSHWGANCVTMNETTEQNEMLKDCLVLVNKLFDLYLLKASVS